jgi:peptidyl-prolyl cis-trans isomerase SurA
MFIQINKILIYVLFLLISNISGAENIKVLIKVNNQIITNYDVKKEFFYLRALNPNVNKLNNEEKNKLATESIIKEKIKERELLKYYEINNSNKYVDVVIKSIYSGIGLQNIDKFSEYLTKNNLKLEEIKRKIEIEIIWNEFIYQRYNKQILIDENKIRNKILQNDTAVENFLLSEILISGENKKKITIKTKFIFNKINEIGFDKTAGLYSNSESSKNQGDLGWIRITQLSKKIKDSLNDIKIGEYTKPIIIPGGIIILMLRDKKKEEIYLDIDKELEKAMDFEKNNKLNQFSNIYFNKIKNQSVINVY